MIEVVVRAMAEADLAAIVAMAEETEQLPHWNVAEFRKLTEARGDRTFGREALVAERDGGLLGFVVASVMRDTVPAEAEIEMLAVDLRARRCGIGCALLGGMRGRLVECGVRTVRLEVRESNAAAIALYRSFGLREVGRRPGYYVDPVEAGLLMEGSPESGIEAAGPVPVSSKEL